MYKKVLAACAGLVLLLSGIAMAGVPCAGTTTVVASGDGPIAPDVDICPNGDAGFITVTVTVRDCYGTPLAGHMVDLVWADPTPVDSVFFYCPDGEAAPNDLEDTKMSIGLTDTNGEATTTFAKFGGCGDIQFYATVGAITAGPSAEIYVANRDKVLDPGGLIQVSLIDFGRFALDMYGSNPCSDYRTPIGAVDLIDFGQFSQHMYHDCTTPNP